MPVPLQAALVSAAVALFTALFTGFITWSQIQRERNKWLIDLKTAYAIELYKTRLASYPKVFEVLAKLSHRARAPVTSEVAKQVARELNDWFYSTGGMCAEASTRGAIRGLRRSCYHWGERGGTRRPDDLYEFRNAAILLLRRDLDLKGLETFEFDDDSTLLGALRQETESLMARPRSSWSERGDTLRKELTKRWANLVR